MNLEKLVEETDKLLPSSQILPRLLVLLEDPDSNPTDVVSVVNVDPALTSQVLTMSNSSYYGFGSPSVDLFDAVNRIGFQELFRMVGICMAKSFGGSACENYFLDEGELWENSVATAIVCEMLAKLVHQSANLAYTLGLLHSLGKLVINRLDGRRYAAVFERVEEDGLALIEAENLMLGFNHADTCDALLRKWQYPNEIRLPIKYQYEPEKAEAYPQMTAILHLARYIVSSVGEAPGRDALAFQFKPESLDILSIAPKKVEALMLSVPERLDEVKAMIGVTAKKN